VALSVLVRIPVKAFGQEPKNVDVVEIEILMAL
jgi:hypothetical protein